MNKDFSILLPQPKNEISSKISPEKVLERLSSSINDLYNNRIIAVITSGQTMMAYLSFTLYLQFTRHNDFMYPLFTAECFENVGTYPINVSSHYGPKTDYGTIYTEEEFENAIEEILGEERTRNTILSMY